MAGRIPQTYQTPLHRMPKKSPLFHLFSRGYSNFTKAMVGAMRESPCKRLILMHSWYTKPEVQANLGFFYRWFLIPMIKPVLVNMYEVRLMSYFE